MANKYTTMLDYNAKLYKQNITLKEYIKRFNENSKTFVKIDDNLIHFTKVEDKYLDKIVDRLELIPNGGVIYLKP